MKYNYSTTADM